MRYLGFLLLPLLISGCIDADRLARAGKEPPFSAVANPTETRNYEPVTMPMPPVEKAERMPNSLWQAGARAFFRDQRAARVGDILTVLISMKDKAKLENKTDRSRSTGEDLSIGNILGLQSNLDRILPGGFDSTDAEFVDVTGQSTTNGAGKIDRKEEIEMKVAATVIQILPNGNMVLSGQQEILVNHEMRILTVSGVIRPEDISSENSVSYEQIAEARIRYGGEGTLSDVQYPKYGQDVYDTIMPF